VCSWALDSSAEKALEALLGSLACKQTPKMCTFPAVTFSEAFERGNPGS